MIDDVVKDKRQKLQDKREEMYYVLYMIADIGLMVRKLDSQDGSLDQHCFLILVFATICHIHCL